MVIITQKLKNNELSNELNKKLNSELKKINYKIM